MKEIYLTKADPIGETITEDAEISITGKFHEMDTFAECQKYYNDQAEMLFNALVKSLPGGTMHALLVKMLENHSILLRVTLPSPLFDK